MTEHLRWREFSDAEREREYSPSSRTGGTFDRFVDEYIERGIAARSACAEAGLPIHQIAYGPSPTNTVDLVVPRVATAPPLVVFIHGGYWQALSKHESFFAAHDALANGWGFAAVDYTLAPAVPLDEIVRECRTAVQVLRDQATRYGYDRDRIVVTGSSAGGHLSAMVGLGVDAADRWRPAGLALVSGVFELEPLVGTTINDAVGLDVASAHRNSPLLADAAALARFPPTVLAWGDNETDEFKAQSRAMHARLEGQGGDARLLEVADRNHFDVVLDLCNLATPLGRAVAQLLPPLPG